jgi:hypothetical protein
VVAVAVQLLLRLYFSGIPDSSMAAFDLMESNCELLCELWHGYRRNAVAWCSEYYCKSSITDMAFEVKSNKYSMYRMCM